MWELFWMGLSGFSLFGRIATWFATWFAPAYFGRHYLCRLYKKGYIAPSASVNHSDINFGSHIFIDDRVVICEHSRSGPIKFGDIVSIHRDSIIQTGMGGSLTVGADTHIQARCIISAYMSPVIIGSSVQIAANCSLYSFDHSFMPGDNIKLQAPKTKGGIVIEDDVWLGDGVIVLDGVKIGEGAVIGAGSVVTHDIPAGAIAVGNPAQVKKMRSDLFTKDVSRVTESHVYTDMKEHSAES